MTDFYKLEYTESFEVDSSLVDGIYYNANENSVVFDLNDELYKYSNVSYSEVKAVADAESPGRAYQDFKRKFGPSDHLGHYDYADFEKVSAKPLTITLNSNRPGAAIGSASLAAENIQTTSLNTFRLQENYNLVAQQEYSVGYVVVDEEAGYVSGIKTHKAIASSVSDAKLKVEELGKRIGLEFKVKEVTVRFE